MNLVLAATIVTILHYITLHYLIVSADRLNNVNVYRASEHNRIRQRRMVIPNIGLIPVLHFILNCKFIRKCDYCDKLHEQF